MAHGAGGSSGIFSMIMSFSSAEAGADSMFYTQVFCKMHLRFL